MKSWPILLMSLTLLGCLEEPGTEADPESAAEETNTPVHLKYIPAKNGSGYSEFIDIEMQNSGYIDVTTFKTDVSLYNDNLVEIDSSLTSEDYIQPGSYRIKANFRPASGILGHLSIFSLALTDYQDIPYVNRGRYTAEGFRGTYSRYYKLDMTSGGYVDVSTHFTNVKAYNYSDHHDSGLPMSDHYITLTGNHYLPPGKYIIKFAHQAVSGTNGTVDFDYMSN